jgi:predicted RNase H-like HicB family nuclease
LNIDSFSEYSKSITPQRGEDVSQVTINIKVPVDIYRDGPLFLARCARFGVVTQGTTFEEAKDNILEAVSLFVETCLEMGTLEQVLKDSGFELVSNSDDLQDNCPNHIELSFPFLAKNHMRECRA